MEFTKMFRSLVSWLPDIAYYAGMFRKAAGVGAEQSSHTTSAKPAVEIKGWSGPWGTGDEKRMLVNLGKLGKRIKGADLLISEFEGWHFHTRGLNFGGETYVWIIQNMFRSRISDMGSSEGAKIGSEEMTFTVPVPAPDTSQTTSGQGQKAKATPARDLFKKVTTTDIYTNGTNNSVDLLERMYHIINDVMTAPGGTKTKGFTACLAYVKNQGVPTVNRALAQKIDRIVAATGANLSAVMPKVMQMVRAGGNLTEGGLTTFATWFESQVNAREEALAIRRAQPPTRPQRAFAIWHKVMKRIF